MGTTAIEEWQRAVVAIGACNPNLPDSELHGSGFIVDLQAGLIIACAHVVLGIYLRVRHGLHGLRATLHAAALSADVREGRRNKRATAASVPDKCSRVPICMCVLRIEMCCRSAPTTRAGRGGGAHESEDGAPHPEAALHRVGSATEIYTESGIN